MYSPPGLNFHAGHRNPSPHHILNRLNQYFGLPVDARSLSNTLTPINIWTPTLFNSYTSNSLVNYCNLIRLREQYLCVFSDASPKATSVNILPSSRRTPQRRPLFDPECKDNDGRILVAKNWRAPKVSGGRAEHRRRLRRDAKKISLKASVSNNVVVSCTSYDSGRTEVITTVPYANKDKNSVCPGDLPSRSTGDGAKVLSGISGLFRLPYTGIVPPLHVSLDNVALENIDIHCALKISYFAGQYVVAQNNSRTIFIARGGTLPSSKMAVSIPEPRQRYSCSCCGLGGCPTLGSADIIFHFGCSDEKNRSGRVDGESLTHAGHYESHTSHHLRSGVNYCVFRDSSDIPGSTSCLECIPKAVYVNLTLREPNPLGSPHEETDNTSRRSRSLKRSRSSITLSESLNQKTFSIRSFSPSNSFTSVNRKRRRLQIGYTMKVKIHWACGFVQFLDDSCVQYILEYNGSSP